MCGIILPHAEDFTLPLAELHEAPVRPFLQHVKIHLTGTTTLWYTSHSPTFVSSVKLLRIHPAPSFRTLMKMLNRAGSSTDHWGTLQVTGLQSDFVPLTTILWVWTFSQISIHLSKYLQNLLTSFTKLSSREDLTSLTKSLHAQAVSTLLSCYLSLLPPSICFLF